MPIIRPATQEEADNRLKNAFINQDFGSLGGEVELYPLPDRKALLYSSATSAWAERILGAPVNPYNPGWQGTKDGIVRNYFGEREAKDVSDEDLFGKIAADYQTLDSLKDAAKIAAYRGETSVPWARRFQEVKEQGKMPLGRARDYLQITKQVHDEYRAKIEPYRQTINTVTALATDGEDAANFDAMARELLKVPKDDRPFVIEALASQAPDVIDQGGISNIALIWGRSIERFLSKSGTGLQEMLTPAGNVSEIPLEPETPEETANREARQRDVEDFRELRDQIRDVANGKLAPVESVRFLGMNISGAVESVPMTMAAFIPYLGPAALIGNFQRETFNELRSTNPTMTREAAQSIATISAPFQALTEVVSDRLLFGKLPSLKRAFTAPAFTAGGVAKQVAQRVAVGTAVETGEEFVQGVTPLLVQSLSADVPGVDWQGYFDRFGENLPEMILTILPLAIVGAGTGQLSDFATGRMLATSPQHLTASGYSPEASAEIANAATSGDWAKAENLMRADWAKVNAKGKAVSEVAGQAAVRVEKMKAARIAAIQQIIAQNKEEETRVLAIEEELKRRGELPDVMINPQTGKYRVIDRDGNVLVETDKRADALNVAYSTLEENQRIAAEVTVQIFDELMATRGTQAEGAVVSQRRQTAQTLVDEGIVSYDQMMQAAMTAAKADGVSEQQAQVDSSTINGFSRAEYWDQVRTMVSRTFATGGVETAIHETVHNRVRRGMANGTYTREMALEWVRSAERALEGKADKAGKPIKFLPSENDAEIDDRVLEEAVAELAVADTIGRRKSGTRFTPGLIAQGISAKLRAEKNAFLGKTKEERAAARKGGNLARFKLFLQGWKETLGNMLRIARQVQVARQEGKLGEDFDAFLDNLLGTDAQSRYDLQTQQEAKQLLEEGNMPFSMNRKGGKPSVKTAIEVDGKIHTTTGSHYDATLDYIVRQMPAFQREDMEAAREKAGEILTNEWLKDHNVKQGFVVDGDFMTREETLAKVKGMGIPTPLADQENRGWFDSQDIQAMQDIRFSSRSMASVLEAALEAQRRNPEFRERLLKLAVEKAQAIRQDGPMRVNKRGVVSQRQGMDTMAENDRTKANIEAERKFRLRSRQRELIDAGMAQLTPETLAAYDQGLTTLEDNPLINSMLNDHGKLMSKTAAQKAGKLRTDGKGNAGDYDDAPRLPIAWYSKTGGIMPDVMAENLGFDSVPAFWEALRSAIYSTRTANEAFKKARAAVRQVEVDALAQATKESNEWAAEAQAKVPTNEEKQLAALRTLDAILSIFPPEISGKIGGMYQLAKANTDAAREKEILKRVEIIDKVLEKEGVKLYRAKIEKLTDRYKSQKDSSGRISGKLLSTATEQVDYAVEVMGMTIEQQAEKGAALEKIIEQSDDADEVQDALNRLGILRLFEMFEDKDSASLESAAKWLEATIEQGKLGKRIVDEARKEFLDDMRESAQAQVLEGEALDINEANNLTNMNRGTMRKMVQGLRGALSEALWTTVQRLEILFGEDSKILNYFAGRVVAAANQSNDIKRLISAQQKDILTVIFNTDNKFAHARGIAKLQKARYSGVTLRNVATKEVKLDIETITKLADGKMSAEAAGLRPDELQAALDEWAASDRKRGVTVKQVVNAGNPVDRYMSELQGIQWRLWWNQVDSKKQMERDGWDEDAIKQLDAFLSDEAKQLGDWIANSYNDAAAMIDPIYRRLFNAPLPRIKNYAPIYRMTLATGADVMDLASSDMSSGLAAGFTKSRVNTTAPLMEMDALAAFLAHWENVSHWVSHAELMRDMKAILLDRNTSTAIRQKRGDGALSRLKEDVKTIESNGTNSAKELTNISRWWRWLMQYRAYKGLAFKISPIMKQTPALLNPLLADVPAHNYMIGLSRAFTSPQEFAASVSAMWKSDEIKRRIEGGFSAEARAAQQGASMSGSQAIALMQAGMMPMAYVDAGWTALGAAVAYDYYKRGYMSQNDQASETMADAYATGKVERMVATSAQPSDIVNRSLYERSGNPFMRSMSMFVSDQRKALAIELLAIRKLATGKSKNKALDVQRILVAHFIQAAVSQLMAGAIASMFGDDDDKEREWSTEQWTLALALGPVNGLFVLGRLIDKTGRLVINSDFYQKRFGTGQKLRIFPSDDVASKAADDLIRGTKSMDELFNPDDAEDVITSLDALSTAAGAIGSAAFGPAAGAVDVSANVLREGEKIRKSMAE